VYHLLRPILKRARFFMLIVLLVTLPSVAQTGTPFLDEAVTAAASPSAKTSDEVKSLLGASYLKNELAASAGPYHLFASFHTYAPNGTPTGDGTIERWMAAPGRMKTVTHFGGHTMTEFSNRGPSVYTDDGYIGSIMSYYARVFLDYPSLPGWDRRLVQTNTMPFNDAVLDCGWIQNWIEPPGYPPMPMDGFCTSRDSGDLVVRQTKRFIVQYQDYAPFLNQSIARTITATKNSQVRCRIKIEQLDQAVLDDAAMAAPLNASPTSPEPNIWATKTGETTPVKTRKVAYPPVLKASHASGLVEEFILISRTGEVIEVEPFFASSPDLEDIGIQTARASTYKPILRDGKPLEVIKLVRSWLQF